jgi:hypothetical protein
MAGCLNWQGSLYDNNTPQQAAWAPSSSIRADATQVQTKQQWQQQAAAAALVVAAAAAAAAAAVVVVVIAAAGSNKPIGNTVAPKCQESGKGSKTSGASA